MYDLETASEVLLLPHQGDNPSLSVVLTDSAVCFTQASPAPPTAQPKLHTPLYSPIPHHARAAGQVVFNTPHPPIPPVRAGQENACLRYGRDDSTYGWADLPSYASLAALLRSPARHAPAGGWEALRSLARLQPALINCREPTSGATFLQLAISHGVDGEERTAAGF